MQQQHSGKDKEKDSVEKKPEVPGGMNEQNPEDLKEDLEGKLNEDRQDTM